MPDADLRILLVSLSRNAREDLRRALVDPEERDDITQRLMRYRDGNGQAWADVIDLLTSNPDARRGVVRVLGELTVPVAG
jgi:hypothetical protein